MRVPENDAEAPSRLLKYVKENAEKDNVDAVVDAIDQYCWKFECMMNVGDVKGKILDEIINEYKPNNLLELGTYCGYSSLRIARLLNSKANFYTVEFNENNAAVAEEIHRFAGMQDKINIVIGDSNKVIQNMSKEQEIGSFDLVFLDHWNQFYKRDLILLEELGMLHTGSVIVADNCMYPGCPDYVEYVRNNPKYKSTNYVSKLEYSEMEDSVEKSVYSG